MSYQKKKNIQWNEIQPEKKKERNLATYVKTWMDLEKTKLSEISQKKNKHFVISFTSGI